MIALCEIYEERQGLWHETPRKLLYRRWEAKIIRQLHYVYSCLHDLPKEKYIQIDLLIKFLDAVCVKYDIENTDDPDIPVTCEVDKVLLKNLFEKEKT